MKTGKTTTPAGAVTINEAAKRLRIHPQTVMAWIKTGRLVPVVRTVQVEEYYVSAASLKRARLCTCKLCGKVFRAMHPGKALFCCVDHKNEWFHARVRRYPRRGRPRKGQIPLTP